MREGVICMIWHLLVLILAALLFLLAVFNVPSKWSLVAAGLFFLTLNFLLTVLGI